MVLFPLSRCKRRCSSWCGGGLQLYLGGTLGVVVLGLGVGVFRDLGMPAWRLMYVTWVHKKQSMQGSMIAATPCTKQLSAVVRSCADGCDYPWRG